MSSPILSEVKHYFERRLDRARDTAAGKPDQVEETFGALVREALRMTEQMLHRMYGAHHYELSVFVDNRHPTIIAYHDSDNNHLPRSAELRVQNPNHYRDMAYDVVGLLDSRGGGVRIISDTHDEAYRGTPEQLKRIGSSILYCFDIERPAALVATCDQRSRFAVNDNDLLELIKTVATVIRADLELRSRLPLRGATSTAGRSSFYSWVHISDVHFGANPQSHRFDQASVCRALLKDVERNAPPADALFITGDIAFRAADAEYTSAAKWLKNLQQALGLSEDRVFLVPGNHDIDRALADGPLISPYHASFRSAPRSIEAGLTAAPVRAVLLQKLAGFDKFVRDNFKTHPRGEGDSCVDWSWTERRERDGRELELRVVGLSSVWVSDSLDGRRDKDSRDFFPNMALSRQQLETIIGDAAEDDVIFLLTHHPPEWMLEACQGTLQTYLAGRRLIHLCGHIHSKNATIANQLGHAVGKTRFVAGAAHNEESPSYNEHGYAWGALRWHDGSWQIGWAPRIYVRTLNQMRADRNGHDLEDDGFAWARLPWR